MQELTTTDDLISVLIGMVDYIKDHHADNELLCHPLPADVFMASRDMNAFIKILPDSISRFRQAVGSDLLLATVDGKKFGRDFDGLFKVIERGGRGMVVDLGFKTVLPVEYYMLDRIKGILNSKINKDDFVVFNWPERWEDGDFGDLQFINLVDVLQDAQG
ncbi:hypothetical protein ACEUB2_06910 [Aeromonas veronii]|uniref:hypothetical protein n=1 Tax=Aeromonas veronii TaxID=654 RepID=UPI00214DEBFF|nr:hypothetical protein [Aeromonas veronii]MCR3971167.1 hypothetical protein [Aeromonas veronii]MCR3975358.1 hypothetical protein [Aeromonas veronii]